MREIITIGVGQCGVQCTESLFELLSLEHGVNPQDGVIQKDSPESLMDPFFVEDPSNQKYKGRACLVDLDPVCIEFFQRKSPMRNLFEQNNVINAKEDGANNYARAHYTAGREIIDTFLDRMRIISEECDSVQGSILFHGLGGGTGSGLSSLILERLSVEFGKSFSKFVFSVCPSKSNLSTMDPYNCLHFTHTDFEHSNLSVLHDNQSIYNILKAKGIEEPVLKDVNRQVAIEVAGLFSPLRFPSISSPVLSMNSIQTNLVIYPRVHFVVGGLSPMNNSSHCDYDKFDAQKSLKNSLDQKSLLFTRDFQFPHKIFAVLPVFRGNWSPFEVIKACETFRNDKKILFEKFIKTGINASLSLQRATEIDEWQKPRMSPMSLVAITNETTSIKKYYEFMARSFDLMYAKRAFVHWNVGEGMSEGEHAESREDIEVLIRDYHQAESEPDELPDLSE